MNLQPNIFPGKPYDAASFDQLGVGSTWQQYADQLTWGKGQCLAILDDGCDLTDPAWQVEMPWGPKVVATHNSIDGNDDPTPVPPGYHGTSVGYPSSLNHLGVHGIAHNDFVAQVRCVTIVHLRGQEEAATMAAGLQWVLDHHEQYNITTVNLSPLDDERHRAPVATPIDDVLAALRQRGIWVSAPCGNHHPLDNIFIPGKYDACKNAKGLPTNFSGLWWDHGTAQIAVDWAASLAEIKARGATWDYVSIDTECDMARHESAEDFCRLKARRCTAMDLDFHSRVLLCDFMTGKRASSTSSSPSPR